MSGNIVVFDVGKTNKKLLLFNENYSVLDTRKARFSEYEQEGVHYEPAEETARWFLSALKVLAARYSIDAISVTTHGATIVCVGEDGKPVLPVVAYTTEPGSEFHERFYAKMGDPVTLQKQTATPCFGNLLSPAKTVFYIKEKFPVEYAQTKYVLNYPQYFAFLLTGRVCAEPTYVGCHSYLWDFHNAQWSVVAARLKLFEKLPPVFPYPWQILGRVKKELAKAAGLDNFPVVPAGMHDSNASLLPYLVKGNDDFVLISTGTWCVAMRPAVSVSFGEEELGKSVYYLLSAYNMPVKTAIFMAGLEYETYTSILKNIHGDLPSPPLDPDLINRIAREKDCFILPSVLQGTGQFPSARPQVIEKDRIYPLEEIRAGNVCPGFFRDYARAMAVLNLSLAIQTRITLERIGAGSCRYFYIEGGFRQNEAYHILLGRLYPGTEVYISHLEEATAFGAALAGKAALEQKDPRELAGEFELQIQPVKEAGLDDLTDYMRLFLSRLE